MGDLSVKRNNYAGNMSQLLIRIGMQLVIRLTLKFITLVEELLTYLY